MSSNQKTFLLSLDGWGLTNSTKGNAIDHAKTPVMDALALKQEQYVKLNASGLYVGLPEGVMGNSEVGHLTMGAGRQIYTDLVKINFSIKDKTFGKNPQLLKAFETVKNRNSKLHFLGLLSDGGVHSHIEHLFEFLNCAKQNGVQNSFVHAFIDGRDTPPNSGVNYVTQLMNFCDKLDYGKLSTFVGRFYAMDRDKRWERINKAYQLLCKGVGDKVEYDVEKVAEYFSEKYRNKIFDEMMDPVTLLPENEGKICDKDVLIFIDFRSDRMREIVETFGIKPPFDTDIKINVDVYQMTEYSSNFKLPILFPPEYVKNSLSECISNAGLTQYHVAETEKYAHVTFFFNGRNESAFKNEERELIPSPKVKTYDLKPDMSMPSVANKVVEAFSKGFDFIMCNFAPPDMVGHTGNYEATVQACEATDKCIGQCIEAAKKAGYVSFVTADHGNAEEMLDAKGNPKTSHNCNLVPLAAISPEGKNIKIKGDEKSSLKDVAPTILEVMGLEIPEDMTGKSLLVK